VLRTIGRHSEARAAADRAIGLTEDASVREFLIRRARRDHE
jgi:predicted RNA polymerase sigma factor